MSPLPNTPHLALYPNSDKSLRTMSSPRVRKSGEFSAKTNLGRTSSIILAYSFQSPERFPPIPAPPPAELMSWQGNPPQTTSTAPRQGFPSKVQTSSQMGNLGSTPSRCRCSKTCLGYSSISTAQTVECPRSCPPRIPPPAPANKCSSFTLFDFFS